jgi:preprotein translocase SecF subunit
MSFRDIFPQDTKFDFLGKKKFFLLLSFIMVAATIYIWILRGPSSFGIDFTGGLEITIQTEKNTTADKIRSILDKANFTHSSVQGFANKLNQFNIRLPEKEGSSDGRQVVLKSLGEQEFGKVEVLSSEFIGPVVGKELQRKALIATIIGIVGIMIYLKFRFEYAFAFGAIVALLHDIVFSLGVYLWLGYSINMETLAAILTILGYSVNDTIVIFDRVREDIFEQKGGTLSEIVNRSINAMLSRTIITHMLTLSTIIALLVFGTGAIKDMSVFLVAGMISGSYSTMYIASPAMIWWHKLMGGSEKV